MNGRLLINFYKNYLNVVMNKFEIPQVISQNSWMTLKSESLWKFSFSTILRTSWKLDYYEILIKRGLIEIMNENNK